MNSFENCLVVVVLQKSSEAADDKKKRFSGRKSPYRYTKHTHNSMHHCVPSLPFVSGNEMGSPICLWSVTVRVATESAKNNTKWSETRPAKPIWGLWEWVVCRNGAMNDSNPIFA